MSQLGKRFWKERIMDSLNARPTVMDLAETLESDEDIEDAEVRIKSEDGTIYELVGAEFDEDAGLLYLNCGAKIGDGSSDT